MTVNVHPRPSVSQLNGERPFNLFGSLLREIVQHGDTSSVARALGVSCQLIFEMTTGQRRSPFEAAAIFTEQLRRNSNPRADEAFLALARRLGFVAYRENIATVDDAEFAVVLRDFSDVVDARADAERPDSPGGADITTAERRELARRSSILIEAAAIYRDTQLLRAAEEDKRPSGRRS
jgi:hypothetical protein